MAHARFSADEADELRLAVHLNEFRGKCRGCSGKGPGCSEDASFPLYEVTGRKYYRCPFRIIKTETMEWVRWYNHYEAGYLPVGGGLLDQAAKFLEAMQIIGAEVNSDMQEKMKKQRGNHGRA